MKQLPRLLKPELGSATWNVVSPYVATAWEKGYEELAKRQHDLEDDILRRYSVTAERDVDGMFPESLVVVMRGTWDKLSESWQRIYLAILDADDNERRTNKQTGVDIYEGAFTCLMKNLVIPYMIAFSKKDETDSISKTVKQARTPDLAKVVKKLDRTRECLCCCKASDGFGDEIQYHIECAPIVPARFTGSDTQGMIKLAQSFTEVFFGLEHGTIKSHMKSPGNYVGLCSSCHNMWHRGRFAATAEELKEGEGVRVRALFWAGIYRDYQRQKSANRGSAVSVREWFRMYRDPPLCPGAGDSPKELRPDTEPPRVATLKADFVIKALLFHCGVYHVIEERRMAMDQLWTDGTSDVSLILSSFTLFSDFRYQPLHECNINST